MHNLKLTTEVAARLNTSESALVSRIINLCQLPAKRTRSQPYDTGFTHYLADVVEDDAGVFLLGLANQVRHASPKQLQTLDLTPLLQAYHSFLTFESLAQSHLQRT